MSQDSVKNQANEVNNRQLLVRIYSEAELWNTPLKRVSYLARRHGDPEVRSIAARILVLSAGGGRPKGSGVKLRPCMICGGMYSAREMRVHLPACRRVLKREERARYRREQEESR